MTIKTDCIYTFIAFFDIVPLKMHWDKSSWFYDIDRLSSSDHDRDKHELLFHIINRGLFSLWVNCIHDLAVKTQAFREFFILRYFDATWNHIPVFYLHRELGYLRVLLNEFYTVNFQTKENSHYASVTHDQSL